VNRNKKLSYLRDRATCYVSKFVLCFMRYGSWKGFRQQKWPNGAIW